MRLKYHGIAAAAFFCVVVDGALAGLVVDVSPENPTTATPVSVSAGHWFPSSGYSLLDATYGMTDNQIRMDVAVIPPPPGSVIFPMVTFVDGTANLGLLAEGSYKVDATMYFFDDWWDPDDPSDPGPVVYSGTGSFDVVPEPTTLCLFTLCGLALVRRYNVGIARRALC